MGKKPVLGLVGLCVGLTLSGCKDCGGGWFASRKDQHPAVAKARKTDDEVVVRKRTVPDRTTTVTSDSITRPKKMYDYDVKEHSAPTHTTDLVESREQVITPPAKEVKLPTSVVSDPKLVPDPSEVKPASDKKLVTPPAEIPQPPLSQGELPAGAGTAPANAIRYEPPAIKSGVPERLPEGDKPVLDLKPAPKKSEIIEVPSSPVSEKPTEHSLPVATPVKTPAPVEIPAPSGPMLDPTPPGPMINPPAALPSGVPSLPIPTPVPEAKGTPVAPPAPPPVAPPASEPSSGPEISVPPPLTPPAPGK